LAKHSAIREKTQTCARGEELAVQLARHGLRATRQRLAVLRLLRTTSGHATALELYEKLVRTHASLSQKTVYLALAALVAVGLATRVSHGVPARYEARRGRHYHAECRVCGRLFDIPPSADGQIRGRAALPEGFTVEGIHVFIEGRCLRCRDEI